jgi:integrase
MIENEGFNPFCKTIKKESNYLVDLLYEVKEIKDKTLRLRSRQTYNHTIALIKRFLEYSRLESIQVDKFGKPEAVKFCDYLISELKYKSKTVNGVIGFSKTLFYALIERGYISENPFASIKRLKEDEGKNVALTAKEVTKLTNYLQKHNMRLYYATQFVRYAFLRKTELVGLRVRDINLTTHTITISSEVSKTRKQDSVTIPMSLEKIIKEMNLDQYNPNDYVFGHGLITCGRKLRRLANISDAHREATVVLKLRSDIIFYGWKHTGCVELYNKVKDPYVVCRQCRHSDIRMTMRYMRSLGLGINEAVREW